MPHCEPAKLHGRRNHDAIKKNRLPINVEAWPEEVVPLFNPALNTSERQALDGVMVQIDRIHAAGMSVPHRGLKRSTSQEEDDEEHLSLSDLVAVQGG